MNREEELETQLEKSTALNKVLLDTSRYMSETIKHIRKMYTATVVCLTIIICTMVVGFLWYEDQYDTAQTTTMTTPSTTDMDTQGENANINVCKQISKRTV